MEIHEIRLLFPGVIIVIFENKFATQTAHVLVFLGGGGRGKFLSKNLPDICIKCGRFYLLGCFVSGMCFFLVSFLVELLV